MSVKRKPSRNGQCGGNAAPCAGASARILRNPDFAAALRRVNRELRERRKTAENAVRRVLRKNGAWAV